MTTYDCPKTLIQIIVVLYFGNHNAAKHFACTEEALRNQSSAATICVDCCVTLNQVSRPGTIKWWSFLFILDHSQTVISYLQGEAIHRFLVPINGGLRKRFLASTSSSLFPVCFITAILEAKIPKGSQRTLDD